MNDDGDTVSREVDVELDALCPGREGLSERLERILGGVGRIPPVPYDRATRGIEKGVHERKLSGGSHVFAVRKKKSGRRAIARRPEGVMPSRFAEHAE